MQNSYPLVKPLLRRDITRMLNIDLSGKRALVAGVADDAGFGFAIAKALTEAGASVSVGTWPPALNIFMNLLERGKMDASRKLSSGQLLQFEKIYPLDASFDTLADAPDDIRSNKRYKETGDFSIEGMARHIESDFGKDSLDIVIHSLANGPEVKKPLLTEPLQAEEVGNAAAFLSSPLAGGITGTVVYVDKGYHSMGMALQESASPA